MATIKKKKESNFSTSQNLPRSGLELWGWDTSANFKCFFIFASEYIIAFLILQNEKNKNLDVII